MEEATKQEGEFSLKGKGTKPKQLNQEAPAVTKVSIKEPVLENKEEVTKVVIPNDALKPEENAIQEQEAEKPVLRTEQPEVGLQEVGQVSEEVIVAGEDVAEKVDSPLQQIEETAETKTDLPTQKETTVNIEPAVSELPEGVNKLLKFMEETGGDVQDYARLNADYSAVDNTTLIKEYYKQTKPHLDSEDVSLLLEDFSYDAELDEDRDIRKKKLAFKEEVASR